MKRLNDCNSLLLQLKYKEQYHKTKDKYTTVLKTADHDRIQNLKHLFSNVSIFLFNAILELWSCSTDSISNSMHEYKMFQVLPSPEASWNYFLHTLKENKFWLTAALVASYTNI